MCWVYILENPDGKFYVGQTEDLATRVSNHNRADKIRGKFTRKNGRWRLGWSESHPDRASAVRRECQIKSMESARWIRGELLNGRVPTGRDYQRVRTKKLLLEQEKIPHSYAAPLLSSLVRQST